MRLSSLVGAGSPSAAGAGVVTLAFPFQFHADQCDAPDNRVLIEEVLTQALGVATTVRCVVGGAVPAAGAPASTEDQDVMDAEAAEAGGAVPDADEAHRLAVQTLQLGLGAVLVDDD